MAVKCSHNLMQTREGVWKNSQAVYVLPNSPKLDPLRVCIRLCEHKAAIFYFFYKIKPTKCYVTSDIPVFKSRSKTVTCNQS